MRKKKQKNVGMAFFLLSPLNCTEVSISLIEFIVNYTRRVKVTHFVTNMDIMTTKEKLRYSKFIIV